MISCNMRENARFCLERAKAFIAQSDEDSAKHACLELRLAIEYLVYQQLQAYLAEIPDEAMRKWTPRDVIAEMLTVDPHADQTSTISVGIEERCGEPAKEMKVFGEDRRFSLRWATSNHNALGNFLHAPTLFQIDNEQRPSGAKMLKKAGEVAETIERTLNTPIFNVNLGLFYTFDCDCGRRVKRRSGSFRQEDGIKCRSCGAIWDTVAETEGVSPGQTTFKERKISYPCFACSAMNHVGIHHVKEGQVFVCDCGAKAEVTLTLHPLDDEPRSGLVEA
jgi:hypothetical protein